MAEDNTDEIVYREITVKNDSTTEDSSGELVSPVTSVRNDSISDNTNEQASPATSVKNDSAGSKSDNISSAKPRSLSNRNKVLPCYRNPSISSYNGGNTRRQSTGKLESPVNGQDVLPHYLRASTGSCHDFCKYGRKHSFEAKPWHPLSKRKNKLPGDGQSPVQTAAGEAKKGNVVKQKPPPSARTMLGEEKKLTGAERKPSSFPESMRREAKKDSVVKQKPLTTSGSTLGKKKNGTVIKQKPSSPPGSMAEYGKKATMVNQNPSALRDSTLRDGKEVAVVEQKPSSPPGSLGEGIAVTEVNQTPSTPHGTVLREGDEVARVEQKLSTSQESMLGEGEKMTLAEQNCSTPSGTVQGVGKKVIVDNQSPKIHSLEPSEMMKKTVLLPPKDVDSLQLDSSSDKTPDKEKKVKYVLAKHSSLGQIKLKMVRSSSKTLEGGGGGKRKDADVNSRKRIIVSKVSAEKSLKTPTVSCSPKSSSVKPLILRAKSTKSLKLLAPLKDQIKTKRDGTNKLKHDKTKEGPAKDGNIDPHIRPPSTSSAKSSSQSQSRLLSSGEEKKSSAADKYSRSKKLLHTTGAESAGKIQKKTMINGKAGVSDDSNSSVVKLKFRRGKVVDLQQETSSPRRLIFRWGRRMGESQDSRGDARRRILKKKGVDGDKSSSIPNTGKIVLRHQDVQEKKDAQGLLNNVIEETASKLVESKKSKVKALVGAFETVISLQDKPSTVTVS